MSLKLSLAFCLSSLPMFGCAFSAEAESDSETAAQTGELLAVSNAVNIADAVKNAKSGAVISIAPGRYDMAGRKLVLSASNVTLTALSGATLDFGASKSTDNAFGIDIKGNNNHLYRLTIMHAGDNGIHISGSNNTVEGCALVGNHDTGLQISGQEKEGAPAPANNRIINCDSHDNFDTHSSSGGDADGFAAKINIGPGNRFFGCVAHDNSDDGWDLFPKVKSGTNPVTIENCVSYHNGYIGTRRAGNGNGIKLGSSETGGAVHVVKNSVCFDNPSKGFDQNHNRVRVTLENDTSVDNMQANFAFDDSKAGGVGANISNSVATGGFEQSRGIDRGNIKNAARSAFINLDPTKISREADGTLHLNGFGTYRSSSVGAHF